MGYPRDKYYCGERFPGNMSWDAIQYLREKRSLPEKTPPLGSDDWKDDDETQTKSLVAEEPFWKVIGVIFLIIFAIMLKNVDKKDSVNATISSQSIQLETESKSQPIVYADGDRIHLNLVPIQDELENQTKIKPSFPELEWEQEYIRKYNPLYLGRREAIVFDHGHTRKISFFMAPSYWEKLLEIGNYNVIHIDPKYAEYFEKYFHLPFELTSVGSKVFLIKNKPVYISANGPNFWDRHRGLYIGKELLALAYTK